MPHRHMCLTLKTDRPFCLGPGAKKSGEHWLAVDRCRLVPPAAALVLGRGNRIDTHLKPLLALVLELHLAVDRGEQGVIRRTTHVASRMKFRPALAHDDAARGHEFPAVPLHAEVLGIRVAPVARGADALLMSHGCLSRPSRRRS